MSYKQNVYKCYTGRNDNNIYIYGYKQMSDSINSLLVALPLSFDCMA